MRSGGVGSLPPHTLARDTLNLWAESPLENKYSTHMSFQHPSHTWLLPAMTIAFLTGCEPTHLSVDSPSSTTAYLTTPVRGIQYYSRQNAKYLGSESSVSTGWPSGNYMIPACPSRWITG
jgi:hypothetical protein